mgnify:CR=1 FL=1
MNFFDELIEETEQLVDTGETSKYPYSSNAWQDMGESHIVLSRDTAFELNGIGFNLVTSSKIGESETIVIGDELKKIKDDRKFARVSIIEIDDVDDEQKAYNLIRKIEYVKYHYFPLGYMIRTSSEEQREIVRVSKSAIKKGISFENVGNLLESKFLENESVKAVKTYFINKQDFDYSLLENIAEKNNQRRHPPSAPVFPVKEPEFRWKEISDIEVYDVRTWSKRNLDIHK